jgi:hypothetical protein
MATGYVVKRKKHRSTTPSSLINLKRTGTPFRFEKRSRNCVLVSSCTISSLYATIVVVIVVILFFSVTCYYFINQNQKAADKVQHYCLNHTTPSYWYIVHTHFCHCDYWSATQSDKNKLWLNCRAYYPASMIHPLHCRPVQFAAISTFVCRLSYHRSPVRPVVFARKPINSCFEFDALSTDSI